MMTDNMKKTRYRQGQLLVETLLAISAAVIVLALGAQLVYVSLRSSQVAADRNGGLGLMDEGMSAARTIAAEQWQSIYTLSKNSAHYHPTATSGAWAAVSGDDAVTIGTKTYIRYFTIANVCRDAVTRDITGLTDTNGSTMLCTMSGGAFDPSTQSITMFVQLPEGGDTLHTSEYLLRWRNKVCAQTDWSGGAASGVQACPDTTYASKSNITAGADLQLTPQ